ncbi:sugar isomerase domain-containing protein [Actinophytocola sp. NPDC049390]|uniref:sugar isomerase domain-containing protein n=1 Tax=Actinophytocola sp. NPDC049390 TaxID=3363894 RepID=UPI00379B1A2E
MSVSKSYLDTMVERLQTMRDTQLDAINAAAQLCADTILGDNLVFTFGTGHGGFAALEMFPRTGTITGFRPIVDTPIALMHHVWGDMGTFQYRFLHSRPGYGPVILKANRARDGDALMLFSHSGINNVILDMALEFKEKGRKVVAITSIPHSSAVPSRHASGRRLYEVADIVVDTGVPKEDASQFIEGLEHPVGPTSTSIAIAAGHAIVSATTEEIVRRGKKPYIMVNTNTATVEEAHRKNEENYEELWRLMCNR